MIATRLLLAGRVTVDDGVGDDVDDGVDDDVDDGVDDDVDNNGNVSFMFIIFSLGV